METIASLAEVRLRQRSASSKKRVGLVLTCRSGERCLSRCHRLVGGILHLSHLSAHRYGLGDEPLRSLDQIGIAFEGSVIAHDML
ncbi:hypothetical protein MKK55_26840 [Methylobacterium sp. J-059]|uniref:hypothetical protein n=1 Tax=Methylobacterium sp. J-059 TaxID=2836643 RepID=UPI001FBAC18E|nr:hypothetical protein [Methylobacterium sp. J-059]MCJ2042537.1 hypothetical protein [Methylobacterium sp. J-059]